MEKWTTLNMHHSSQLGESWNIDLAGSESPSLFLSRFGARHLLLNEMTFCRSQWPTVGTIFGEIMAKAVAVDAEYGAVLTETVVLTGEPAAVFVRRGCPIVRAAGAVQHLRPLAGPDRSPLSIRQQWKTGHQRSVQVIFVPSPVLTVRHSASASSGKRATKGQYRSYSCPHRS